MGRRVGIVTTWFERGAAYVSRQYRDALAREHDVFIYARGGERSGAGDPRWDGPGVTWARQGLVPTPMSIDLDDFSGWLERTRIEVVFFNEQHWWKPVLLAARRGLVTGAYVDYYTPTTLPFFDCYDFLACNTKRHYSVFAQHPQAFYVPWGTDLELFRSVSFEPVESGVVTFFHSCGMSPPRKGTDALLRAFGRVKGPARLVIHTQHSVEQCFPDLQPLIADLKRGARLTIHEGTVPAPGLYHRGDVYVYPSRLDGIGLTIAEALACGLPVITSDNPPMNEFITESSGKKVGIASFKPREDGYYWPQCLVDEDDLSAQMQSYVDAPERISQLKRRAREYAESSLDWRKNSGPLAELFNRAATRSTTEKAAAIDRTAAFERERARQSGRFWLSYHFPGLVRSARNITRAWTGRRARG
jgi:glycosyltransferase involved in cell wall biosynthesis